MSKENPPMVRKEALFMLSLPDIGALLGPKTLYAKLSEKNEFKCYFPSSSMILLADNVIKSHGCHVEYCAGNMLHYEEKKDYSI